MMQLRRTGGGGNVEKKTLIRLFSQSLFYCCQPFLQVLNLFMLEYMLDNVVADEPFQCRGLFHLIVSRKYPIMVRLLTEKEENEIFFEVFPSVHNSAVFLRKLFKNIIKY